MRSRLATFVITALVGGPALASAQSPTGAQPEVDTRVRTRVTVQQQQQQQQQRQQQQQEQRERMRESMRQSQGRHEESETVTKTVKIGGNGEIIVSNWSGDITVTRGSGNEVQIEARKVARGRDAADAREQLGLVKVDITERGNRVEAKAAFPGREAEGQQRRRLNVSIYYTIVAPGGSRISARTLSGDVKVADIRGDIVAESTSGNISIVNAERISTAETKSGNVDILNSTSEVPFEAHSMSGDVTLRQVKAPRIEAASISGKVILADVQTSQLEAQSISGDVEFTSAFAKGGRYEFSSHSGTVRLAIMSGSGFEIEANSFGGSISADPSLNLKREEEGGPGRRRERTLRGVQGDGSALVEVSTFSGSVVLTKK